MKWVRTDVSAGLPMSFFDNPEVPKTVLMTTECGQNYIRTKPGGVKEPTLTHRTFFTTGGPREPPSHREHHHGCSFSAHPPVFH
jgi:hypothetical protein